MRYIDLDLLVGSTGVQALIDAAEAAHAEILAAPDPLARTGLMESKRRAWVSFRPNLEEVFGQKCWYTESKNSGSDDDIDHYRPKGRISESPDHGGYWWEAFNWRNFRLSCHRANRLRRNPVTGDTQGKGDHFPLLVEDDRWYSPGSVCREHPSLLDPTDPEDPPLLTFDPDGRVALSPYYENNEVADARVETSRIYLHLDWPAFVDDRQELYTKVYIRVMDGDRASELLESDAIGARDMLKTVARDLIRLTDDKAEYSRAAVAYIRRFRDRDWIKRFVLPHIPDIPTP